jgi:hypothetical protein
MPSQALRGVLVLTLPLMVHASPVLSNLRLPRSRVGPSTNMFPSASSKLLRVVVGVVGVVDVTCVVLCITLSS